MASSEDVLLTFDAKDNVSAVASKIGSSVSGMGGTVRSAVQNIASEFGGIDSAINGAFSAITGKSIYDQIMGTTSTAETNKVLLSNMASTQQAADSLYKTVDEVTNNSLTSMQDLIPALNQIKSATASSDKEITNISDDVANFGAYVSAMTGSSELAKTAMGDLAKGIKGAFASLDQYGISEDALMNTGLWSGKEDDVEGYMAAVTKVIGSTDELMNTSTGLDAQINKAFSRGGKRIGNDFLPYIEAAKRGFLDLDNAMGGRLTEGILAAGAAVTGLSTALSGVGQLAASINGIWMAFDNITGAIKGALGITQAESAAYDQLAVSATAAAEAKTAAATAGMGEEAASTVAGGAVTSEEVAAASAHASAGINPAATGVVVDGVEETAEAGAGLKTVGPEIAAETAGAEATGIALDGLSAAISSMLVPLLAISAVIAIMIPIVAGLVAEALLFIKGIQQLIKNLHFEDTDLTGAIKGLKQIGQSLWQLASAVTAMTITAVVSTIFNAFHSIGLGLQQIGSAANKIKAAIPTINSFANVQNINKGAINKLKAVCEGLNAMSQATHSLSATSGEVAWDKFWQAINGGMLQNLKLAHDKLVAAVPVINSFASMPEVNQGASKKLKAVSDGLKSASDAIHSLSGISGEVSWDNIWSFLNGGMINNLRNAHDKLVEAAGVLATFQNMPTIPNGVGNKIQRVTWTLNNVRNAIRTLNGNNGGGFKVNAGSTKGLSTAVSTIRTVAGQLRSLSTIANIPTNTGTKIQRVTWSLNSVRNAVRSMTGFPTVQGGVTAKVSKAVSTIRNVASQIRGLGNVNVGKASSMIAGVRTAFNQIITTLNSIRASVVPAAVNIGRSISNGVRQGLAQLPSQLTTLMVNAVNSAAGPAASASWTAGSRMGTSATNAFRSTLKLADVARAEMTDAVNAINSGSGALADAARKAAESAVAAAKEGADRHSPGAIARMWGQEMQDSATLMTSNSSSLIRASRDISRGVVSSFNNGNRLSSTVNSLTSTLRRPLSTSSIRNIRGLGANNVINTNRRSTVNEVHIHEGAIQLDARNLTTKESKQIMINALEGLNAI